MAGEAITARLPAVGRSRTPQGVRPRTLRLPAVRPRRGLVGDELDVAELLEAWLDARTPRRELHMRVVQLGPQLLRALPAALDELRPAFDLWRSRAARDCERCWHDRLCVRCRGDLRAWWDARDGVVRAIMGVSER